MYFNISDTFTSRWKVEKKEWSNLIFDFEKSFLITLLKSTLACFKNLKLGRSDWDCFVRKGWLELYCGGELTGIILLGRGKWDNIVVERWRVNLRWRGDRLFCGEGGDLDHFVGEGWLRLFCGGRLTGIILRGRGNWDYFDIVGWLRLFCGRGVTGIILWGRVYWDYLVVEG